MDVQKGLESGPSLQAFPKTVEGFGGVSVLDRLGLTERFDRQEERASEVLAPFGFRVGGELTRGRDPYGLFGKEKARVEEVPLRLGKIESVGVRPLASDGETTANVEVALVPAMLLPLAGRLGQPVKGAQALTFPGNPIASWSSPGSEPRGRPRRPRRPRRRPRS